MNRPDSAFDLMGSHEHDLIIERTSSISDHIIHRFLDMAGGLTPLPRLWAGSVSKGCFLSDLRSRHRLIPIGGVRWFCCKGAVRQERTHAQP